MCFGKQRKNLLALRIIIIILGSFSHQFVMFYLIDVLYFFSIIVILCIVINNEDVKNWDKTLKAYRPV